MHEISMCFDFQECEMWNKIDRSVHKVKLINVENNCSKWRFMAKFEQNTWLF